MHEKQIQQTNTPLVLKSVFSTDFQPGVSTLIWSQAFLEVM